MSSNSFSNPLTTRPEGAALAEVGRLYLLTRDAYLSAPDEATRKLDALEDLRRIAADHLAAIGTPVDLGATSGVRLVERLRIALRRLARGMSRHERALVLLEILTVSAPPCGGQWAASRSSLGADLAGHIAPEVPPGTIDAQLRHHRAVFRTLYSSGARGATFADEVGAAPGELGWVSETYAEVFGLHEAQAAVAAVRTLDARGDGAGRGGPGRAGLPPVEIAHGIVGGALFEPVDGPAVTGPRAFVGGVLADAFPLAFLHHLATLDVVAHARPDLRAPIHARLGALRGDLVADPDRPVTGSVRALDTVARRLDGRPHLRAERLHARWAHRGLFQP